MECLVAVGIICFVGLVAVLMVNNDPPQSELECAKCHRPLGEYFVFDGANFLCEACSPYPRKLFPPE